MIVWYSKTALFIFVSALVAPYICYVEGQTSCTTPSGADGSCISVYNCSELIIRINSPNKSPQEVLLLKKSLCGYDKKVPKVCCPAQTQNDTCLTPDGQKGKCKSIYSCQHLVDKLKPPPVPKESIEFVKKFRCNGTEPYSVCCGPPPSSTAVCTLTAAPPDPKTRCCGVADSSRNKFFSFESEIDQYPWLVLLEYVKKNRLELLCGGALISGRYVLTAGHCVAGPLVLDAGTPKNVRLGEFDTSSTGMDCAEVIAGGQDCTDGAIVIPIEEIIAHPQYDPSAIHKRDDIALLRLRQLAPYTDFIRPICLPSSRITVAHPPDIERHLLAAGWGTGTAGTPHGTVSKSNRKLQAFLPLVSQAECQPAYSGRNVTLWKGQLCAGGRDDSCRGDSGGPLMHDTERTVVIGIASFSPTCGKENTPGVYTNVLEYEPWIRSQISP